MVHAAKAITAFSEIADDFDLFLFDQWGVVHDGVELYPQLSDCLEALRRLPNKTMLILSNSSKRANYSEQLMNRLGLRFALWDEVITSGEHCLQCLRDRPMGFYADLGRNYYGIHWAEGYDLPSDLDYTLVDDIDQADFVLLTGMTMPVADYMPLLERAKKRDIPIVCANPDLHSPEGGVIKECPGLIADSYMKMGGRVSSHGKPAKELYDLILQKYGTNPNRVLAIGDSLSHDIQGANNAGISSLLLTQGIHRHHWQSMVAEGLDVSGCRDRLAAQYGGAKFDYVMHGLVW